MNTPLRTVLAILLLGAALSSAGAGPETPGSRPLPFSDDRAPPPRLPVPLDRHFKGEIVEFGKGRIRLRWDWSQEEQLDDFETFVPVRASLDGGFEWSEGALTGRGTGGLRLRFGLESDFSVRVAGNLLDPHDLGIVLAKPDASDETVLCLVQDRFFTQWDAAAGNTNMINKLGGIPPEAPGRVEFRYVDRQPKPAMARGADVRLEVVRKARRTEFRITPGKGETVTLAGDDPTPSFPVLSPGLYTSGGSATFGQLEIEGLISKDWCVEHRVLPHVIGNLLHPGNGFAGADRTAAEIVERFLAQPDAPEPDTPGEGPLHPSEREGGAKVETRVDPEAVARLVGQERLPLVIRIRAAEALLEKGFEDEAVERRVAQLLDAKDLPTRVLAWQVLRSRLPWHFRYEPDAEPKVRREAALLVAHWLSQRDDPANADQVFVDGYWYSPHKADQIRAEWDNAWDLRTPHVRVRTNLTKEWADWYLGALEAQYHEMVRRLGREPPADRLPLSVLVFRSKDDYAKFCEGNGYGSRAAWGRFADVEKGVGFATFEKRYAPFDALNQCAKLFLHASTDTYWPIWFDEGRASFLGDGRRRTTTWDGKALTVGLPGDSAATRMFKVEARQRLPWSVRTFLAADPRTLEAKQRADWYTYAWALYHWLSNEAPEDIQNRFATWQGLVENTKAGPRVVDSVAKEQFERVFADDMTKLDALFAAWLTAE